MAANIELAKSEEVASDENQFFWFSKLPYELRFQIWSLCIPRRVLTLRPSPGLTCRCVSKRKTIAEHTILSMVCQEARDCLLESHKLLTYNCCHSFLYNPRTDLIVINSWEPPTSLRYYLSDTLHPFFHAVRADRIVISESIFSTRNPQLDAMLGALKKYGRPFTLCIAEVPMSASSEVSEDDVSECGERGDILIDISRVSTIKRYCSQQKNLPLLAKRYLQWEGSNEDFMSTIQRQIEDIYLESCFQSDWPYKIPDSSDSTFYISGTTRWNMEHAWTKNKMQSLPTFSNMAMLFHRCQTWKLN